LTADSALDGGTVYKKDSAWAIRGGDVERLTTYDSKVEDGLMEYDILFHPSSDRPNVL
jgi:hypothetical protein